MPEKQIRDLVARLHEELKTAESVDEESRALLEDLTNDIEKVVAREEGAQRESAIEQAGDAALRFESEYPRLAGVLNQIADTLGRLGI